MVTEEDDDVSTDAVEGSTEKSPAHSQTLSRGIRALEILAAAPAPMTIAELSTALGVHRSVAYRILRTLEDHALLTRDDAGRVQAGPGLAALARGVSRDLQTAALPELTDEALDPIREAVALTVAELGSTPLIGFAGAPFTVAAYMVEGRPSRDHLGPRTMMHAQPELWAELMNWAADASGKFLRAQIEAGASAAQLFDSWAGSLGLADYTNHVAPASSRALDHVRDLGVPLIHFGTGTSELLGAMHDVGVDVMGVDYRLPLDEANRRLGGTVPLQGNIDPALLSAPWEVLEQHAREVVRAGSTAPSHVVNLGHGVPPGTDPAVLTRLVDLIHSI